MCGRFALGLPHDDIAQLHGYNVRVGEWVGRDNFVPRYNIAPRSQAPVIRRADGEGGHPPAGPSHQRDPAQRSSPAPEAPRREPPEQHDHAPSADPSSPPTVILHTMKWGLVPHFSKHEDGSLKTINARSEALVEGHGGMWASIKGKKRCAVVCQGYYEWLKKAKERLPHFTRHADGRLMLLAGLWDCTVLEGSTEPLWTFTIVTTDASAEMSWLHDRQPVILPDTTALETWLDTSSGKWTPALSKLCSPHRSAAHPLVCYQVPKEVGRTGTDSAAFVQPVEDRKDGIQAMFARQQKHAPPTAANPSQKRSASPAADPAGAPRPKKAKVEKTNAWQDASEIEYVDDPPDSSTKAATTSTPPRGKAKSTHEASKTPLKSPKASGAKASSKPSASPRKSKAAQQTDSSAKITSFFTKKQ